MVLKDHNLPLTGQRVLVTGASGYLGSHMARALYDAGARVILHGRNAEKLDQVRAELFGDVAGSGRLICLPGDLNSRESAQAYLHNLITATAVPDILVNCMGHAEDKPFVFHQPGDSRASFAANLHPFVHISEALLPHWQARANGNLINMASITGLVGQPMRSLYGAAKGAVIAYCKTLARRHAVDNIRVNCIAPQVVTGGLADKMNPKIKALLQATTPIQRDCVAADLVAPLLMLATQSQGFMTGEVVNVTGGLITW
ncbi:MAG TPA: SDR family oxidoreductase [Cellvibrio sp.]|nr:SDR family oxidoreductase [Cellvibrio sp.]